jgi:hypothetical protein
LSQAWKHIDLRGGGLQHANLQIVRQLKRRRTAYLLLLMFPLGLHRIYLRDRLGAWMFPISTLGVIAGYAFRLPMITPALLAVLSLLVLYDIRWIDRRVGQLNKRLRMETYMKYGDKPPPGYRGRDFGNEAAEPGRFPSFAEQEAMLKEMAKRGKE